MKEKIRSLLEECMQFNANDLLVNIETHALLSVEESHSFPLSELKSVLKKAHETVRETGVNPLCVSSGLLRWKLKETDESWISTPLFLQSCQVKTDRVKAITQLVISEERFINPFVLAHLKSQFELEFNEREDQFVAFLRDRGFAEVNEEVQFLGNFHPHRFEQIRELDNLLDLEESPVIATLFGEQPELVSDTIELSNYTLFPSDPDQNVVFEKVCEGNVVVQGPPGTGKSQVLSNLLAKLVFANNAVVLVSEKKVALEVIAAKLKEFDLNHLCYVADASGSSKDLLKDLKQTWKKLEQMKEEKVHDLHLSAQYLHQLEMQLELISNSTLFGGVDFSTFSQLFPSDLLSSTDYNSQVAELSEVLQHKEELQTIYALGINKSVTLIKSQHFKKEGLRDLDGVVKSCVQELLELKQLFSIEKLSDLEKAMKMATLAHLYQTKEYLNFAHLYEEKERQKFLKLYKGWLSCQNELAQAEGQAAHWIHVPSFQDLSMLQNQLQNYSFWKRYKVKKLWQYYSAFPIEKAGELMENRKNQLEIIEKILKAEAKLLAINAPIEPNSLHALYHQLMQSDLEKLSEWKKISIAQQQLIASSNSQIASLYSRLKLYFSFSADDPLEARLLDLQQQHALILLHQASLTDFSNKLLFSLGICNSFEEMQLLSWKAAHVHFTQKFPNHRDLSAKTLLESCESVIAYRKKEAQYFASCIRKQQVDRFAYFHEILRLPSQKLSAEEKKLKPLLKKGKAILVKEFAKTRNHPSLRELFASEARLWIQALKPIWLCNPTQIARCFPMEQEVFDFAIFDEASQIAIHNALGTIYRAKRVLLAGDSQQMGPSNYFKAQKNELMDILHQASFHWQNVELHHHYRSEHPALIAFSNSHFYRNQLVAFPSPEQQPKPIEFHYCSNGLYDNRSNVPEAKMVGALVAKRLSEKGKIGIVAFSETQLEEIIRALPLEIRAVLEEKVERNDVFLKALENVQGDECDYLIISLGYGRDLEGNFHHRFGPLNSKNGGKRLNVLLTRARKHIDFVASVKTEDFAISQNENVELLRNYIAAIETGDFSQRSDFPFGLNPTINGSSIEIKSVFSHIKNAEELITLVTILQHRKWKINFS